MTDNDLKRLLRVCRGELTPQTIEELAASSAYGLKLEGLTMRQILTQVDPPISKMDIDQVHFFLVGIALAEDDILELDIDFVMEVDDKITH